MEPQQHQSLLGTTFVEQLTKDPVFEFNGESFSRHFCVTVLKCGNFRAFRLLQGVLHELGCRRLDDILSVDPVAIASIRGIGETTLYSLLCYIEYKKQDPRAWYQNTSTTYASLKRRALRRDGLHKKKNHRRHARRMLRRVS